MKCVSIRQFLWDFKCILHTHNHHTSLPKIIIYFDASSHLYVSPHLDSFDPAPPMDLETCLLSASSVAPPQYSSLCNSVSTGISPDETHVWSVETSAL